MRAYSGTPSENTIKRNGDARDVLLGRRAHEPLGVHPHDIGAMLIQDLGDLRNELWTIAAGENDAMGDTARRPKHGLELERIVFEFARLDLRKRQKFLLQLVQWTATGSVDTRLS